MREEIIIRPQAMQNNQKNKQCDVENHSLNDKSNNGRTHIFPEIQKTVQNDEGFNTRGNACSNLGTEQAYQCNFHTCTCVSRTCALPGGKHTSQSSGTRIF